MDVEVRRATVPAEEEQSLSIYNEVWPRSAVTMDDVESWKRSTRAYADHLAHVDGRLAGSGTAAVLPARPNVAFVLITVRLSERRRGAGTALYRTISGWCAEQGLDRIETRVEEDDPTSLDHALRRGFVEIERNGGMVLDLAEVDTPAVHPPPGIEIVSWAERPDASRGIYEVAVEAYSDVPGSEHELMEPYEDWLAHDMQGSGDRPEATFVALAGSEVVGYAKFSLTAAQPTVAHHDMTGVRRAWRGKGVAGALKRAQIGWAKAQGYERLMTANEMRNEPIRKLNARLGYHEEPGRILLSGPLLRP